MQYNNYYVCIVQIYMDVIFFFVFKDKLTALMLSPLKPDLMKVDTVRIFNFKCERILSPFLPQSTPISEEVVLLMADILAVLASSENGRQHLLFGEKNNHSDE